MKSGTIFKFSHGQGDERHLANGTKITCQWDTGHVVGSDLAFPAVVLPDYEEDSKWYLINLCNQNYAFLGVIAVLGALSADQASDVALRSFNADFGGIARAGEVVRAPTYILKRILDNRGRASYAGAITQEEINTIENKVTQNGVVYETDESSVLKSHAGYDDLMHDILRHDEEGLSLFKVDPEDILSAELQDAETDQYDAIVSQASRLDFLSNRILVAMDKASDKVKPVGVTKSEPFKKNGVVNVAQVFTMDDGQTLTIVYHNPDATPKRLDAKDLLTSWKFLQNKRDVSVVLQPKSGKDVNIPILAKRMMQLIEANSARFKRTQERKIKAEVALDELSKIESERVAEIAELDKEIVDLEKKLDTPISQGIQQQAEQAIPETALVDKDGNLYNKKTGKPFPSFSVSRRFMTKNELTGYVPMVVDGGYVLHKLNIDDYPAGKEKLGEINILCMFKHNNRTFFIHQDIDISSKIQVFDADNNSTVVGQYAVDYSYSSVKSAYEDIIETLDKKGTNAKISSNDLIRENPEESQPTVQPETMTALERENAKNIKKYSEQFKLIAEQEINVRKSDRPIDELLTYAKGIITLNPNIANELVSGLQHILNQNPKLKQYHIVIPRNDDVTKGKAGNKVRRMNKAFKDFKIPLSMSQSKTGELNIGSSDKNLPSLQISPYENKYFIVAWEQENAKEYGDLIPALLDYFNEEKVKDRIHVYFGQNGSVIDTATNQINFDLKNDLMEGVAEKLKSQDEYSITRKASMSAKKTLKSVVSVAQTLDPALGAMAELSNVTPNLNLSTPTLEPQQSEAPMNDPQNKDEAWLDDIIAGNIDLAGLDMNEFSRVATPYAEDQDSPMYQKLEQALNAITQAKVAKAKAL